VEDDYKTNKTVINILCIFLSQNNYNSKIAA